MSNLSLTGKLHKVFDKQQVTDSFSKREFVIETAESYPQLVKFELTQDKCDLLNKFKVGETIKVLFNVRGREWNEKFFTNLNAWRIEEIANSHDGPISSDVERQKHNEFVSKLETTDASTDTPDDLPF